MPVTRRPVTEVTVLIAGLITGILLIVIGNAMDRAERARRDRESEERRRSRR
jgi:hypothetical protein